MQEKNDILIVLDFQWWDMGGDFIIFSVWGFESNRIKQTSQKQKWEWNLFETLCWLS